MKRQYKRIALKTEADFRIAEGLTKTEAKEYCQGEESRGEGWFLGFTAE